MIKWIKTHKPLNWKAIMIFFLLFQLLKDFIKGFMWFQMFLLGFITYPNEIDYVPILEKAGDRIGTAYTSAMTRVYENGFNLAGLLYPHNFWIGNTVIYGSMILIIILMVCVFVWTAHSIMYKKKKKSLRNSATTKNQKTQIQNEK